ncbi:MAG: adenosylcobalamin-dependent ribonucleoside-diphosphate reductase, partial [Bdellovibrionales bacterium]|nr:adenosylcobalamin-dependent ribonucleoside-diphosphate reductase [Bdellovibrionales bacterium]
MARKNKKSKSRAVVEHSWTESAKIVLKERYLRKNERGEAVEGPVDLFKRVASVVAAAESPRSRARFSELFFEQMISARFIPNSPTLMNAGKPDGQLSACFVLPVEDSLDGIFLSLRNAALIHQSGGGTGFSFSNLRPKGSLVRTTQGAASGPVSFIRIFDTATEIIKQGGVRRGANMAVLRVDHPDVFEFIESKRDLRSISNFNISVGITESFMDSLRVGAGFQLRRPDNGMPTQEVASRELFDRIVDCAWECGDPGLLFLDRINQFNPTPRAGKMESTNPCGEQPLLAYESCNLGSVNLSKFIEDRRVLWDELGRTIDLAVRFLDNVVDVNAYPLPQSETVTLANRKIGLGVMGFADLLLELGIPYDSA